MKERSWFITTNLQKKINFKEEADIRFSQKLVNKFLHQYTKKGDKILDPFAGFGTTIITAQKLGRIGYGIEYDKKRFEFIKKQMR